MVERGRGARIIATGLVKSSGKGRVKSCPFLLLPDSRCGRERISAPSSGGVHSDGAAPPLVFQARLAHMLKNRVGQWRSGCSTGRRQPGRESGQQPRRDFCHWLRDSWTSMWNSPVRRCATRKGDRAGGRARAVHRGWVNWPRRTAGVTRVAVFVDVLAASPPPVEAKTVAPFPATTGFR